MRKRTKRRHRTPINLIEAIEPRVLLSATIYVDANASDPTHDGTSWPAAFTDLQQALAIATAGDEIRVADGVYRPTSDLNWTLSFQLVDGVSLLGGFAGDGASVPDARDIALFPSILSGDIGVVGSDKDNCYHVVKGSLVGPTAVLDGFTVTAGVATYPGGFPYSCGGGIFSASGSPTVRNCTFKGNKATTGGAVYSGTSSATFTDCIFEDNVATLSGGAVHNHPVYGKPAIARCIFRRNSAPDGGAIDNAGVQLTLRDSVFSENSARTGGAIAGSEVSMSSCSFTANRSSGAGGALWVNNSTISNCTFSGNVAGSEGGAIYGSCTVSAAIFIANSANRGGAIRATEPTAIIGSKVLGNRGTTEGGGVYAGNDTTLVNCVLSGNEAGSSGGGVFIILGSKPVTLANCTLSQNSARYAGGGIESVRSTVTVVNTVLWDNQSPIGKQIYDAEGGIVVNYSNIQSGWRGRGTGNIDADPLFMDADGPDNIAGTLDDDLRLRSASPVADAGTNNAPALTGTTTDLGGAPRFVDIPTTADTGVGTLPIVDMGAFEAAPSLDVEAGGTYRVLDGRSLTLIGRGSSDRSGFLDYEWDLDGDGAYDDASGQIVDFPTTGMVASEVASIGLRITDSAGRFLSDSALIKVVPTVLYVDASAVNGADDGSDWSNAYLRLESALRNAAPGMEIRVAQGVYKPTEGLDRSATFELVNAVTLLGGYAGCRTSNPDARNVKSYATVLSGEIGVVGVPGDNSYHVLRADNLDSSSVVDGVIVTAGNADGPFNTGGNGGALFGYASSAVLLNCTFQMNLAIVGGGMFSDGLSNMVLMGCSFIGNSAGYGGGVLISHSSLRLVNSLLEANSSTGTLSKGGAIWADGGSDLALINSTIVSNVAKSAGGGIVINNSSALLANCIVWRNSAPADPQISSNSGILTVTRCDIDGGWVGDNIDLDPKFVRNPHSGADGNWATPDDDYGDLRLRVDSPCIDAGDNTAVPVGVTTDIAGNPRFIDIPGVHDPGAIVDLGAYERQAPIADAGYLFDAAKPTVSVKFGFDALISSVSASDLLLTNLTTGQVLDCGSLCMVSYDALTRTAAWVFNSALPDGNYRAILPASSIGDDNGSSALGANLTVDFFALGGDANRDRIVDIKDLSILAKNWSGSGKVFSQGDFNYDSRVDAQDLGILSSHWQKALPPAANAPVRVPTRTPTRVAALVL